MTEAAPSWSATAGRPRSRRRAAHGHLPICVPRDPTSGEHVDDHQQLFARRHGRGRHGRGWPRTRTSCGPRWTRRWPTRTGSRSSAEPAGDPVRRPAWTGSPGPGRPAASCRRARASRARCCSSAGSAAAARRCWSGCSARSRRVRRRRGRPPVGARACATTSAAVAGSAFSGCAVLADGGRVAFGGWDRLDVERRAGAQGHGRPHPVRPAPAARRVDAPSPRRAAALRRPATPALPAVARRSAGPASWSTPASTRRTAFALRRAAGVDLRVLHVVRDSRGVRVLVDQAGRPARGRRTGRHADLPAGRGPRCSGRRTTRCSTCCGRSGTPVTRLCGTRTSSADPRGDARAGSALRRPGGCRRRTRCDFLDADDHADLAPSHTRRRQPDAVPNGRAAGRAGRRLAGALPRAPRGWSAR